MHISLQAQAIVVHATQAFNRSKIVQEFLHLVAHDLVFDANYVRLNPTPNLHAKRLKFLHYMSRYTAKHKEIDAAFLLKSTTRMQHYPMHIYIDTHYPKRIDVHVEALTSTRVKLSLETSHLWYVLFVQSMLTNAVVSQHARTLIIDTSTLQYKEALAEVLRITDVLNTRIVYVFDNSVLSTLFVPNAYYFKILQCDINASPKQLKQSFKRLAKVYHPDAVAYQNDPQKLAHYTQTFQALHEAYTKVAGVS